MLIQLDWTGISRDIKTLYGRLKQHAARTFAVAILEQAERRRKRYDAKLIEKEAIAEQQQIADTFSKLKLIPKQINVKDAFVTLKP